MRSNLFPLFLVIIIAILVIGLVFKAFFWLFLIAMKYWFVIVALIFVFMLVDIIRKKKKEDDSKDYIETQYRVVDDDRDKVNK